MNIYKFFIKLIRYLVLIFRGRQAYARSLGVAIGIDCRIISTYWGTEPFLIRIGNRVTISDGVRFLTHDGSSWLARDSNGRRFFYRRIEIGNNVFVGIDTVILPGVKIGDNVIIGAGTIVTKSIPSGVVVAGNPARILGSFADLEKKMLDNYFSEANLKLSSSYRNQVLSLLTEGFRPYLKRES